MRDGHARAPACHHPTTPTCLNVCATVYARKYMFAMRLNCSKRYRGTKFKAVYLEVTTSLSANAVLLADALFTMQRRIVTAAAAMTAQHARHAHKVHAAVAAPPRESTPR